MPKVPKWMADAMQSLFSGMYHPVRVTQIEDVAVGLRSVRFEGSFANMKKDFIPGNVIEFRISDTEFRHYTPSYFSREKGICEVFFYLHDKGPGSRWVEGLREGDTLDLLGPGGKIKYDLSCRTHLAFGDETSLGLLRCISSEAENRGDRFVGIAELDDGHAHWPQLLGLKASSVCLSGGKAGVDAIGKLQELLEAGMDSERTAVYLTGNARSILSLRKFLLEHGFSRRQVHTEPYWAEGKPGL
ncbi:siderophore-interacting protein [Sphingobacterium bambusae]|uniref:Siderophore-interacting protein n=1 Tax=Sphingobacterium bambusae TaxID=662858 RepID=A0ABW6BEX4_9SPHI|nr:siderophore-interacting protein [Sphingobacterium bambusae]WPL49507.1 siderophore-interacting protein [Sphingobacterium bambusae]